MSENFTIQRAITSDAPAIAVMAGELLSEIMRPLMFRLLTLILPRRQLGSKTSLKEKNILYLSPAMRVALRRDLSLFMKAIPYMLREPSALSLSYTSVRNTA